MAIQQPTPLTISIQGELGSYHDKAAGFFFGEDYRPIHCDTFDEVFAAVESGEADFGMSAVENSIYGGIPRVHDLLAERKASIIGEVTLGIHHSLIAHPGVAREEITQVHSHPVALAQCAEYIAKTLGGIPAIEEADTAGSVEVIKNAGLRSAAAIASADAAGRYGMQVIESGVEDNPANFTRFLALQKGQAEPNPLANKTSLLLESMGDDKAGQLAHTLGQLAASAIKVPRLEPRPVKGEPWSPAWFIDVESGLDSTLYGVLDAIEEKGASVHVLGSYRQGPTI